ncbi:MAG TPA: hypothetical protein VE912_02240, partial [Bacteroidales bacterium]|nr:hypothetical protein [Bacteroidales bacterium]
MKKIAKLIPGFMVRRCPKSGKIIKLRFDNIYAKITFPLIGVMAIIWFLVRVVPKPNRIAYPCQQVAAGIGSTFLIWLFGSIGSLAIYDQIRKRINKPVALVYLSGLMLIISIGFGIAQIAQPDFVPNIAPPEGVNNPMGDAKGIFPGRVAWTQDFNATSWDGKTGMWWDNKILVLMEIRITSFRNVHWQTILLPGLNMIRRMTE